MTVAANPVDAARFILLSTLIETELASLFPGRDVGQ